MSGADVFFDTNVLLYLLSAEAAKADRAEELLAGGGSISVQVLNEFAAVASRKLRMPWPEIIEVLHPVRTLCQVHPMSAQTHDLGIEVAQRYGYAIYDASILASALMADCTTLYSEDMQSGQLIERRLTIRNPFAAGRA
jgi:predicted nucleic acid-binding protein